MSTQEKGNISAGFDHILVFTKNSSGQIIGSNSTEPVAGAQDGNYGLRLEGAMTAPVGQPDSEFVDVVGDDEPEVQFDFGSSTQPSGILEVTTRNLYFEAMIKGTTAYAPNADILVGTIGASGEDLQDLAMLLGRRAKTNEPGLRGSKRWELLWIPSATLRPLNQADWTQRTHGPLRYSISISKGNTFAWGETMYSGNVGTNAANFEPVSATNPHWIDIFKGNGTQTVFNLTRTPVLSGNEIVTVNKVIDATGTITASPNIITFSGPPANGALIVVFYPVLKKNFTL
jgi:hypothetical protein